MKYYHTYLILLLCTASITLCAKPQYVFQSENPIANFAWDENDTSLNEGHYRYEQAYKMIEDMLSDVDDIRKWLSVDPLADKLGL